MQAADRIAPVGPSPSILTSARDRSADNFGIASRSVAVAEGEAQRTVAGWTTGIEWNPTACAPAHVWPRCPVPPSGEDDLTKEEPAERGSTGTDAFKVYVPMACGPSTPETRILDAASRELIAAKTPNEVARALWLGEGLPDEVLLSDGTLIPTPTLRRVATAVNAGVAMDLDDAMADLRAARETCTGGAGAGSTGVGEVFHVPSTLHFLMLGGGNGGATLATREGALFRATTGGIVSPGPGYPAGESLAGPDGFGPLTAAGPPEEYAGNAADEAWIYLTGPVEYALTDPEVLPEGEDARELGQGRTNTYEVWAERWALVRFDPCCVFAALVNAPYTVSS